MVKNNAARAQERTARIRASVSALVERAADPTEPRLMAVVTSPHGWGRNASLRDALHEHARGRSVMIPAEGISSDWDALAWIVGAREELANADVVVVDGLFARESTPALASIVRLLAGETVEAPVKFCDPLRIALKPGFSLILSEPDRTGGVAASVLDALVSEDQKKARERGEKAQRTTKIRLSLRAGWPARRTR